MKRSILLLMVVVVVLGLAGCDLLGQKEVLYQVTGSTGSVDIRYENEDGDLEEVYNITPPWSHSFTVNRVAAAILVYISAEIVDLGGGDVTVTIREDGSFVTSDSNSGYGNVAETWAIIE
jgi:hypothetical protein